MEQKLAISFGAEELNRWRAARRSVDRVNHEAIVVRDEKDGDASGLKSQDSSRRFRRWRR